MSKPENWYEIEDINKIDSPALLIYLDRVKENIETLKSMIDHPSRLRPHIKTHKAKEAVQLCLEAGILKFKCATIAEAEVLGICAAPDVLLAYQPTGPKLERFLTLIKKYPSSKFSCLVDNLESARHISETALASNLVIPVFMDINVGQNRTGIKPGKEAIDLYKVGTSLKGIEMMGLHAYDGHVHESDLEERTRICEEAFAPVEKMKITLIEEGYQAPVIVVGGSPSFPIHAKRKEVECSPGTFIYWDKGYLDLFPDQHFLPAALVLARVISLPGESTLCLDLGHKSIAAENGLARRVFFINAPELVFISQSEEHLVVDAGIGHPWKIGDVLYGMPIHICPTCALYDTAAIIEQGVLTTTWEIIGRNRKINI
ncbi:MAG: D-TA family PLP-dependent enzyme [Chitinophagaceae bacterium]